MPGFGAGGRCRGCGRSPPQRRQGNGGSLAQCGAQTLAAHFQQTELADDPKLYAGTILAQSIAQAISPPRGFGFFHVDEIDQSTHAQITQLGRRATSSASRLVRVAVSSMSLPLMAQAEFTSTATSASVWSI